MYGHPSVYLGAGALTLVIFIALRLLRDPISHVPGPWHVRLTGFARFVQDVQGTQMPWLQALHAKYGPVVRIAPAEVSFNSVAAFKEIHRNGGGGGFTKSDAYARANSSWGKQSDLFSERDPHIHGLRRKLFARVMSARYLRDRWQHHTDERVDLAIEQIRREAAGELEVDGKTVDNGRPGTVDIAKWWRLLAADAATTLSFGESFGNLEAGCKVPYMQSLDLFPLLIFVSSMVPSWLWDVFESRTWPGPLGYYLGAMPTVRKRGEMAVRNSKNSQSETGNIFAYALAEAEKNDDITMMTEPSVNTEASSFIFAGTETTAVTMFLVTWTILDRPDLKKQLCEELLAVEDLRDETLEKCPVLNAVLDETLRLYGPVSGTFPRLVPTNGVTIQDTFIPGGICVTSAGYLTARDTSVFSDPEKFDHTRFMPDNPHATSNRSAIGAFGGGSRICIGMNVAKMTMRKALARFFRDFENPRLDDSMAGKKREDIMSRGFFTLPVAEELLVRL